MYRFRNKTPLFWIGSIAFALVYTLVVTPLTLSFFEKTVPLPQSNIILFGLSEINPKLLRDIGLPFFLAILEFASINLACAVWLERGSRRVLLLVLFLFCQSYAMVSTVYDIRESDYREYETARVKQEEENAVNIKQLKQEAGDNRIKQRESITAQIAALEKSISESEKKLVQTAQKSMRRDDRFLIDNLNGSINDDRKNKTEFQKQLIQLDAAPVSVSVKELPTKYNTTFEYIIGQFWSAKMVIALFIALLFPLTIIGVAYALTSNLQGRAESVSLSIQQELDEFGSIPTNLHSSSARSLAQIIAQRILVFTHSKRSATKALTFQLESRLPIQLLDEKESLKSEVRGSKLNATAQADLLSKIDEMINRELTREEQPTI